MSDDRIPFASLDVQMFSVCAVCAEAGYVAGHIRSRLVCPDCFAVDPDAVNPRRRGTNGAHSGYTYQARRPLQESVRLAHELRRQGLVVGVIAEKLGLSDRTVRNYLTRAETPEKVPRNPAGGAASLHTKRTTKVIARPGEHSAENGRLVYGGDTYAYDLRAALADTA
jgi:hypothetical protein